jgi:transposase
MPYTVPLRDDYDAAALRYLARRCGDVRQAGRLLALACIYNGMSRADAARAGGMARQTLRDWVHRFNDEGPEGLLDRKPSRERRLSAEQMAEFAEIVEMGPDLSADGVIRWRRIDLQRVIEDRFGIVYHERTISKLLKALGYSHMSGRPQHPGQKTEVIEAFKKTSPKLSPLT